jgi:hypothetical protein
MYFSGPVTKYLCAVHVGKGNLGEIKPMTFKRSLAGFKVIPVAAAPPALPHLALLRDNPSALGKDENQVHETNETRYNTMYQFNELGTI